MKYTCKKCGAELPEDMTKECACESLPSGPFFFDFTPSETTKGVFVPMPDADPVNIDLTDLRAPVQTKVAEQYGLSDKWLAEAKEARARNRARKRRKLDPFVDGDTITFDVRSWSWQIDGMIRRELDVYRERRKP